MVHIHPVVVVEARRLEGSESQVEVKLEEP